MADADERAARVEVETGPIDAADGGIYLVVEAYGHRRPPACARRRTAPVLAGA
jgi:hypothetical protein